MRISDWSSDVALPIRIRSVTSIMSTTGKRTVGWQHPSLFSKLLAKRPAERGDYLAQSVAMAQLIGSPAYPEAVEKATRRAEETWDRGLNGPGVLRHMMAVLTQPNRSRSEEQTSELQSLMHNPY